MQRGGHPRASIHDEARTGDVRSSITYEEQGGICDICDLAPALNEREIFLNLKKQRKERRKMELWSENIGKK